MVYLFNFVISNPTHNFCFKCGCSFCEVLCRRYRLDEARSRDLDPYVNLFAALMAYERVRILVDVGLRGFGGYFAHTVAVKRLRVSVKNY